MSVPHAALGRVSDVVHSERAHQLLGRPGEAKLCDQKGQFWLTGPGLSQVIIDWASKDKQIALDAMVF